MKKIMVVDDDPDQIYMVRKALAGADENYEIIPASSGDECLELLKQNQIPDLILLDVMMPGVSGWMVFDKIRDDPALTNIPIVFLTARTDRIAKNAGQFLGADFIEKPFVRDDLKERINKILKKR